MNTSLDARSYSTVVKISTLSLHIYLRINMFEGPGRFGKLRESSSGAIPALLSQVDFVVSSYD